MQSLKRQKILLGILGIVVLAAGFYYSNLWRSSEVLTAITSTETTVVGEDLIILVNKLQNVKIEPAIFQDKLFMSLVDFSVPVNPENLSRPNPFAPIGSDIGVIQVSARIKVPER